MINILKTLNDLGIWDLLNTVILLSGLLLGAWLSMRRTKHIRDLNFYVTWHRDPKARFPLTLRFEVRNLSHNMIALSAPYFVFSGFRPGPYAHCDSTTQHYEVKFRRSETEKESQVACLLRHRDTVTSYIPLDEAQTDVELQDLSKLGRVGVLYCDIVFLHSRPKVVHMKLKLRNVVAYRGNKYPPDSCQAPASGTMTDDSPESGAHATR